MDVPASGAHTLSVLLHQGSNWSNPDAYSSTVEVLLDSASLGTVQVSGGLGLAQRWHVELSVDWLAVRDICSQKRIQPWMDF